MKALKMGMRKSEYTFVLSQRAVSILESVEPMVKSTIDWEKRSFASFPELFGFYNVMSSYRDFIRGWKDGPD